MSLTKSDIYKQLNDSQDKFAYFSLAVAASAIAYALQKTEGKCMAWSLLPLALAVLCWLFSFYLGCQWLKSKSHVLFLNYQLLEVQEGTHHLSGTNREKQQIGTETLSELMNNISEKAAKNLVRHFTLIILGVVCFIIWYVWELLKSSNLISY
jgi:hypothetical protein